MTSYDTAVSNGTCYWKAGAKAGRNFIPCGNAYAPDVNFQCCSLGDICFDNGACYNGNYGATYFAACTDSDYEAVACPNKGAYSDRQWNGLVTCGTSTGQFKRDETWAGCMEPNLDHLTTFTKGCECNDTNPVLFTDYHDLVRTAVLPTTAGGTITFVNGHQPSTIAIAATTTVTPVFPSSGTTLSSTISQTSDETSGAASTTISADEAPGLATGTKVGIGAGVAGAALLFGVVAVLAWLLRRRNKKEDREAYSQPQHPAEQDLASSAKSPTVPSIDPSPITPGFGGFKAELAADGPASGGTLVSPMSLISPGYPQFQGQHRQYEAYNPDLHGNYSQYASSGGAMSPPRDTIYGSVHSVSPQHTGASQNHIPGGAERSGQTSMTPIAELQG